MRWADSWCSDSFNDKYLINNNSINIDINDNNDDDDDGDDDDGDDGDVGNSDISHDLKL